MTDLKCTKCGTEATYNQAECWSNGHTEDGEEIEQNCEHEFVETGETAPTQIPMETWKVRRKPELAWYYVDQVPEEAEKYAIVTTEKIKERGNDQNGYYKRSEETTTMHFYEDEEGFMEHKQGMADMIDADNHFEIHSAGEIPEKFKEKGGQK